MTKKLKQKAKPKCLKRINKKPQEPQPLDEDEWQSLYITVKQAPPPQSPPTLNAAIDMIAKLGGYLGRINDGPPGTKAVWIGIQRMRDFTLAISGYKETLEQRETYV